jgi:hypothetical protein
LTVFQFKPHAQGVAVVQVTAEFHKSHRRILSASTDPGQIETRTALRARVEAPPDFANWLLVAC